MTELFHRLVGSRCEESWVGLRQKQPRPVWLRPSAHLLPLLPPERLAKIYAHFEFFLATLRLARIYGDFDQFDKSGMRVDSGLVILIAIVTALVIVALALLFYSPGWSGPFDSSSLLYHAPPQIHVHQPLLDKLRALTVKASARAKPTPREKMLCNSKSYSKSKSQSKSKSTPERKLHRQNTPRQQKLSQEYKFPSHEMVWSCSALNPMPFSSVVKI